MSKILMVGCDLHDDTLVLRFSVGAEEAQQETFVNTPVGRARMIKVLNAFATKRQAARISFVYEASGQGFGLADLLTAAGIEAHVLSPTHLPKTPKHAKQKNDPRDAQMLLEVLRGHLMAGNALPVVWTPSAKLREDRELVRARIDIANESTRVKAQILSLLKRLGIEKPTDYQPRWSKWFVNWLRDRAAEQNVAVRAVFLQKIGTYEHLQAQQRELDKALEELAHESRYQAPAAEVMKLGGVGILTAMTFLTEMGDLDRFHNRREVAAYLGVCPASYESGQANDRKGHITRQGPARLRRILCQAAWISLQHDEQASADYARICQGKKSRKKKALVAIMRKLAIRLWHIAKARGVSAELRGRGGPHDLPPSPLASAA
jgi:transposase